MFCASFDDNSLNWTTVFKMPSRLKANRIADESHSGQPSTNKTDYKLEKTGKFIQEDRCLSIKRLPYKDGIGYGDSKEI